MGGILSGSMVLRDEQPVKFSIGAVAQLLGDCRGLSLNPQELVFRAKLHDFIRGQQITSGEVVADTGRITRSVAFGLIAGGFLSHHLAQPFGRLKIIHPKDLLHPGIGDECSRPFAVEVLELAHVLQNRPELKPIARHKPHGAFHGLKTAQSSEFIQQEEGRAPNAGFEAFQALCGAA